MVRITFQVGKPSLIKGGNKELINGWKDNKKYPPNWLTEIRPDILERDHNKCKFCGLVNYLWIFRDKDGNPYEAQMVLDALEVLGYDYFKHELQNIVYLYTLNFIHQFTVKLLTKYIN